jgi:hypothetical protein
MGGASYIKSLGQSTYKQGVIIAMAKSLIDLRDLERGRASARRNVAAKFAGTINVSLTASQQKYIAERAHNECVSQPAIVRLAIDLAMRDYKLPSEQ